MDETATDRDEGRGRGLADALRLHVELWLVVVFMALAFGAGILVTALYEEPAEPVVGVNPASGFVAPPLTDEEISQGLPSGHPDLGGATGATGAIGGGESAESNDVGGG